MKALIQFLRFFFALIRPTTTVNAEEELEQTQAERPIKPLQVVQHRLEGIQYTPSPNTGGPMMSGPDTLLLHYTETPTMASALRTLTSPTSKVSAHLLIDRDGTIHQLVPFTTVAWHAGVSEWEGRQGLNSCSIGIELVNAGRLLRKGDHLEDQWGHRIPEHETVRMAHPNEETLSWWHLYTGEQVASCEHVCRALMQTYSIEWILGHDEVSPGRKTDPGPAFPIEGFRRGLRFLETV